MPIPASHRARGLLDLRALGQWEAGRGVPSRLSENASWYFRGVSTCARFEEGTLHSWVGQGCNRRGGRGLWLGHPSTLGPPMVPTEGGPKFLKLKSSWHRRRRSKILTVSLKHWKGKRGGFQGGGGRAELEGGVGGVGGLGFDLI